MVHTSDETREAFSRRLREALDYAGVPPRGAAPRIAQQLKVSNKAAYKYLNEESMPERPRMEQLAAWLRVRAEWLQYGIGPMKAGDNASEERARYVAEFEELIGDLSDEEAARWLNALRGYLKGSR